MSLFYLKEQANRGGVNDLGQYFTPHNIIDLMYFLANPNEKKDTIFDPYCGTGGILLRFIKEIQYSDRKKISDKRIFGSDSSKELCHLAQINMILAGDGHSNIAHESAIAEDTQFGNKKFDLIVSNMPFSPKIDIDKEYINKNITSLNLSQRSVFIENCLVRAKKKVILIVGKSFFEEKKTQIFFEKMMRTHHLTKIIDLWAGAFSHTKNESSIMVWEINKKQKDLQYVNLKNKIHLEEFRKKLEDNTYITNLHIGNITLNGIIKNGYNLSFRKEKKISTIALKNVIELVKPKQVNKKLKEKKKRYGTPTFSNLNFFLEETNQSRNKKSQADSFNFLLEKNIIVVNRIIRTRGKEESKVQELGVGFVFDGYEDNLITNEYHQFKVKDKKMLNYILIYLKHPFFQNHILDIYKGMSRPRVYPNVIMDAPFITPTQAQIKQANNLVNEYIDLKNKLNGNAKKFNGFVSKLKPSKST